MILRGKDDIHRFRIKFKSLVMGKKYKSLTIGDAEQVLRRIAKRLPLRLERLSAKARLRLPYPDNMRDVIIQQPSFFSTNTGKKFQPKFAIQFWSIFRVNMASSSKLTVS